MPNVMENIQRFTASHPCPICGGHEDVPRGQGIRCFGYRFPDGNVCCTREEHSRDPSALKYLPESNGWLHKLNGDVQKRVSRPLPSNGKKTKTREVETYPYRDKTGALLYEVVRKHCLDENGKDRIDPLTRKPEKTFCQRRPDGKGGWIYDLKGVKRVLYRLPELTAADLSEPVYITEGEKHADRLAAIGFIATSAPMGAGKWKPEFSESLRRRNVVIIPDNDEPGRAHGAKVAAALSGIAASVKVLELPGLLPKGDVIEWLAAGGKADELKRLTMECPELTSEPETIDTGDSPIVDSWPSPLDSAAFYGLAGDFVRLVAPHTESDPAALLIQLLVSFGNVIGRSAHWRVVATKHYLNLFAVLVGSTAKGRKGTSLDMVLELFGRVDPDWLVSCVKSGLSTGEGLKFHVRDAVEKNEEITDGGITDKRLLTVESEFANILNVCKREGNTLSTTIRQSWDTGNLRNLTKNDPTTATGAHISIVGHITSDELLKRLSETESSNGFANRFLWLAVRRSKLLPRGGNLDDGALSPLVLRLHQAVEYSRNVGEMGMTESAWAAWDTIYPSLSRDVPGLLGMVTSRAEAQVRRLACIYALLDSMDTVDAIHLQAALAVWQFCEDSSRFIFGDKTGNAVADTILDHLQESSAGLSRTEISNIFERNKSKAEIQKALSILRVGGLAHSRKTGTNGKVRERWFAGYEERN